jgi:simple sugar transport system permease protein
VVAVIGEKPGEVLTLLVQGAFGSARGISYTFYYATNFVFTGLAVAVAAHAGLFNIGGEGQATVGGIAAGIAALVLAPGLPAPAMLLVMLLASMAAGAAWAAIPGYLQAYRGSHVVITTIMFNFLANILLVYLLVNVLPVPQNGSVETPPFAASAHLPQVHEVLAAIGIDWPTSPLNLSVVIAAVACVAVWAYLWRSRAGYRLRAVGSSASAAEYAGIRPQRQVVVSMAVSGALAGLLAMNEIAGVNGKLLLDFAAGAGFTGIAVSIMGRNHPAGIVLASLLFGALFQGGTEVSLELPGFSRDMVVMVQGFIVLFSGAMAYVLARPLSRLLQKLHREPPSPATEGAHG